VHIVSRYGEAGDSKADLGNRVLHNLLASQIRLVAYEKLVDAFRGISINL